MVKDEVIQETVVIALKSDEKNGILEGHSYRVLKTAPSDSKTLLIRCNDWAARELPRSKFTRANPTPIKK